MKGLFEAGEWTWNLRAGGRHLATAPTSPPSTPNIILLRYGNRNLLVAGNGGNIFSNGLSGDLEISNSGVVRNISRKFWYTRGTLQSLTFRMAPSTYGQVIDQSLKRYPTTTRTAAASHCWDKYVIEQCSDHLSQTQRQTNCISISYNCCLSQVVMYIVLVWWF